MPPINQPRSRNIDVKHLVIDLRFDWKKKRAYGTIDITFSPLKPTDKISLDAGMLAINSISANSKKLKFEYDGGDKNDDLKITLDHIYSATENLQKAVEEMNGEKMQWFFDRWIFKMGHPVFEVRKNYDAAKKDLTLNVRQVQKIDSTDKFPQTKFFQGKIEIEIDGKIKQVWIKPQAENIFKFNFPSEPKFINFDFESAWIKEIKFEKSLGELLAKLKNSRDALARQSAIGELANLYKDGKTSAENKTKTRNILREIVSGNSYWRLRNSAMFSLQIYPRRKNWTKRRSKYF